VTTGNPSAESVIKAKIDSTTKHTKSTKEKQSFKIQVLFLYPICARSFENTGREGARRVSSGHSSLECWNQTDMDVSGRTLRDWMPAIHAVMTKISLFHSLQASVSS